MNGAAAAQPINILRIKQVKARTGLSTSALRADGQTCIPEADPVEHEVCRLERS